MKGVIKQPPTIEAIITKHKNVTVKYVKAQLRAGIAVEHEHTDSDKTAQAIALHHIYERPDYYQRLKKVE